MKGKSAIHIARTYLGQRKNYGGMSFWARGYFVSTVGADETVVRAYIRDQEQEGQRLEQPPFVQVVDHRKVVRESVE